MCNSISRQSIRRANSCLMNHEVWSFSTDGTSAQILSRTKYGSRFFSVPTRKIIEAAETVMRDRV